MDQAPKDMPTMEKPNDQVVRDPKEENPIYKKVLLDQRILAGFFIRLVAFVIDLILISGLTKIVSPIFSDLPVLGKFVSIAIYLAYFILTTGITKGQTLGKMILGLKVVRVDGSNLNWVDVFFREGCCRLILKVVSILYLLAAFTDKKQHLGDLICDTLVIKSAFENELFYEQSFQLPSYQKSYFI